MAANLLERYIWLVDIQFRYEQLTFQEINELWKKKIRNFAERLMDPYAKKEELTCKD